jgi:hypothetical protein
MNPFAAMAIKVVGGGAAATILSLGVAGGLAQAASPSPSPSPTTTTSPTSAESRADRRAVRLAVVESEADVLGIKPEQLRADLKAGQKVSDLARDKGMTKEQFEARMIAALKPRLEQLVAHKQITQARADRIIDRISKGHVPFWDGVHRKK